MRALLLKIENWTDDQSFLLSFAKLALVIGVPFVLLPTVLLVWFIEWQDRPAANELVTLNSRYWQCTSTHVWHHDPSPGILTRFGRVGAHGEYDTDECDQWSARFVSPHHYPEVTVQP